ncbi:MAG: ATP-binding protein [Actinomycetota bacterium]|nr:ATP-binding protein [Actinomycetota bacterium]
MGAPGCGKTMLAQRLPGLLPPLTRADALAVARVQSAAGLAVSDGGFPRRPPFRAPHHGATVASLTGGGSWLRPGEISLAHASLQKCY